MVAIQPFAVIRALRPLVAPMAVIAVSILPGFLLPDLVATYGARDLLFLVIGLVLAGVGILRPSFSVVTVVAAFVFLATLRRIFPAANPGADPAAIVPFVVALPLAARGLRTSKSMAFTLFLMWTAVSAGLAFARPLVSIAGLLNVGVPLLVALGLRTVPRGLRTFARSVVLCGAVAATYGVFQYFVPFSWDVTWLDRAGVVSAGTFGTETFRPFATLPAPVTAATLCAAVVLVVAFKRSLIALPSLVLVWAVSSSTVLLLLTQVRSVWLTTAVAVVVGAVASKGGSKLWVVVPVVVVLSVLAFAPQGEIISDRAQTLADPEADVSFRSRITLLGRAAELASPFGRGPGSLSAGSRVVEDQSIDNGYLVVLGELGLVGAALFAWLLVAVVRRSRPSDYPFLALLVTLNSAGFALAGLPGVLLWVLSGVSRESEDQADRGRKVSLSGGPS